MDNSKRIALSGFSRVSFFPVVKNDSSNYEVGEKLSLHNATEMTKVTELSEQKIYADDGLYMNLKSYNGINATITLAEMTLEMIAKLGFGEYDKKLQVLRADPQGKNLEFAVTYRAKRADGLYRMFKMYSFVVNEVKESGLKTMGEGIEVNTYQVIGTFTKRKCDDSSYEIHDGSDMSWLDTIESVTA